MNKLAVIVPYRDREEQLELFIEEITNYLDSTLDNEYVIIVSEQIDQKKFNRGKLLNIGFLKAVEEGCDYVIFHDVDMLPLEVDYSYDNKPLQIANEFVDDGEFTREIQRNYFGGVTLFPVEDFQEINGYSNLYKGWGFEDDDLLERCRREDVKLHTEKYRVPSIDREVISFNGETSKVKFFNWHKTVRPFSYVTTFVPGPMKLNPSEFSDEFAIFGIPGTDLMLSYSSFGRVKFEFFLKDNTPVNVTSDYVPSMPMQAIINVNPKLKRVQLFINGVEVGNNFWHKIKNMRLYEEEPFYYLGVADPVREDKHKYFNGKILNFGILFGELSKEEAREWFLADHNIPILDSFPNYAFRFQSYFDAKYTSFGNLDNHPSLQEAGITSTGQMIDCEIEHLSTNKIFKLGMPTRRKGKFKLKKHEELGYQDGYWKDWSSRENQLRYYRFKDSEDSLHKEDGLNSCKYRIREEDRDENVLIIKSLT